MGAGDEARGIGRGRPAVLDFGWIASGEPAAGTADVLVPEDSAWFAGHFPGRPILAGAVQLSELVLPVLRRSQAAPPRITGWSGLKFLAPILPGDRLTVQLDVDAARGIADFLIRRGAERCSVGRVRFDPDPRAASSPATGTT